MQRHSISLVSFCLLFGILIGVAGLLSFALMRGLLEPEAIDLENNPMSATERLENYQCRFAETKQIIMGGIEDNYDPDGEEAAFINPAFENWVNLTDNQFRTYDEAGPDKRFVDDFDIPTRTYHGIVAIGLKEVTNIHNDDLQLSIAPEDLLTQNLKRFLHHSNVAELDASGWHNSESYYWADLENLDIVTRVDNKNIFKADSPHLLSAIRDRKTDEVFNVMVVDDTLIDFIGFGLCLEPEEKKGFVYGPSHYLSHTYNGKLQTGHIFLSNAVVDGKVCGTGGCLSCDIERPVACIKDENLPAPNGYDNLSTLWSGGYIDFTPAISGSSFATEDEVDNFCEKNIGDGWRHLNAKDGSVQGHVIGLGQLPKNYSEFWVGMKDSPHHNCWELRPDYKAENEK